MKVYRVMPDSFYEGFCLNGNNTSFEDIYYKMGYISFKENNRHCYNTIYKKLSNDEKKFGKYFFLFIDDALWHGFYLLQSFSLRVDTFMIVEYEIPDELILKHIGYGDYSKSAFNELVLECFITKDDFEGLRTSSINLTMEKKEQELFDAFKGSLERIIKYDEAVGYQLKFYKEFFSVNELNQIVTDSDLLSKKLLSSPLCASFLNSEYEIIKTPFVTGRIIYINYLVDIFNIVGEKMEPMGTRFADYEEKNFFKEQLLFYSDEDTHEAKEKMKVLLKSKGYMS